MPHQRKRTIVIEPRCEDIWAGLIGHKGEWGTGKSVNEALGNLVMYHQDRFRVDVQVVFHGKPETPFGGAYVTIPRFQYKLMMKSYMPTTHESGVEIKPVG